MIRLRGLTWSHRRGLNPLVAAAAAYGRSHRGVTVDWEAMPWDSFREATYAELSIGRPRDLYVVDHPWVPDLASRGFLIEMDDSLSPSLWRDIEHDVDHASVRSYRWAESTYALPIDASCLVLPYRVDLCEGEAPPATWPELLRWAKDLHRPPSRHAFTVPWGNPTLALTAMLGAIRPDFLRETPEFRDDEAQLALEALSEVWRMSLPVEQLKGRRPYELLLSEDVAVAALGVFAYVTYLTADPERLAFAPMPRWRADGPRTSMLGGAGLAVSAQGPNRTIALDVAAFAMSQGFQASAYIEAGGQPGRRSSWSVGNAPERSFGEHLAACLDGCYTRPLRPGWMVFEEGASRPLLDYLKGRADRRETVLRLRSIAARSFSPFE